MSHEDMIENQDPAVVRSDAPDSSSQAPVDRHDCIDCGVVQGQDHREDCVVGDRLLDRSRWYYVDGLLCESGECTIHRCGDGGNHRFHLVFRGDWVYNTAVDSPGEGYFPTFGRAWQVAEALMEGTEGEALECEVFGDGASYFIDERYKIEPIEWHRVSYSRGRPPAECSLPYLSLDIRSLEYRHHSRRLDASEVRRLLIEEKGYSDEQLPTVVTIRKRLRFRS